MKKIKIKKTISKTTSLVYFTAIFTFTSCSKDIYVNFQTESSNTGKIVLRPSKSTDKTFVTINDNLIVNKKNVKSVTINNVPYGNYIINYTSENGWYKEKLNAEIPIKIENNKEITKLVEVPPYSTGYWVYVTGTAILPWVILFAL